MMRILDTGKDVVEVDAFVFGSLGNKSGDWFGSAEGFSVAVVGNSRGWRLCDPATAWEISTQTWEGVEEAVAAAVAASGGLR